MSQKCHSILQSKQGATLAQIATLSFEFKHGHVIPEHSHPEDQFVFASNGVMTVHTKQGIWVVPPLRAVWIPAGTPHSVTMSGAVSMRTLYLAPKLVRGLPARCFVMNVSAFLKELVLHACNFPRLNRRVPSEKRIIEIIVDQMAVASSIPLQLPNPRTLGPCASHAHCLLTRASKRPWRDTAEIAAQASEPFNAFLSQKPG